MSASRRAAGPELPSAREKAMNCVSRRERGGDLPMAAAPAARMTERPKGVSPSAPGPMTGERYIASLRDGREVWIDGKRAEDVTTHPAFKDMVGELARIYDLQNSPRYRDEMTCLH